MKILVVDDHPVLRDGISALLQQDGDDTVVLQAGSGAEAIGLIDGRYDFDAVLLDLRMPDMSGLAALAELRKLRPGLPVIMLSSSEDPQDAREAFAHGALGYVPKSASRYVLISAVRLAINGDRYVPALMLDASPELAANPPGLRGDGALSLTLRQIEVLRLVCDGRQNKIIASELGLSEKTVKAHVTAIFKALNVINRTQAAAAAQNAGLI